jgi:hypothetical protein
MGLPAPPRPRRLPPKVKSLLIAKNRAKDLKATSTVKRSTIYFLHASISQTIKIGTTTSFGARLRNLQTGSPSKLVALSAIHVPVAFGMRIEKAIHSRFAHLRTRGEWFRADPELVRFATDPVYRESLPWWQSILAQSAMVEELDPHLVNDLEKVFTFWRPLAIRVGVNYYDFLWLMWEDGEIETFDLRGENDRRLSAFPLWAELKRLFGGTGTTLTVKTSDDAFTCFVGCLIAQMVAKGPFVTLRPGFEALPGPFVLCEESGQKENKAAWRAYKKNSSVRKLLGQLSRVVPSKSYEPDSPTPPLAIPDMGISADVTADEEPELLGFSSPYVVGPGTYVGSAEELGSLF